MNAAEKLHPQYIIDDGGQKKAVVLSIDEYEMLLEDLDDLAVVAERRDEATTSHADFLKELEADGI